MIRTGIGVDAHRFADGRRLVLGGVVIPHGRGLAGHSDADALSHAVADALLGAVAAGDIGTHFPDTDSKWKGVSSLDLLRRVGSLLGERNVRILNVDATVIAEAPRLAPYAEEIRRRLAGALAVPVGAVSVKATTVEGMGALGRQEGVAAIAVATVDGPA